MGNLGMRRSMASRSGPAGSGKNACMAEPVSWFLIESGWSVVDRSGAEVGEVVTVLGDEDADIFHGLHVRGGDGVERYAPGEKVGPIEEGRVSLVAPLEELEPTPAGGEPGGAEITRDRDAEL
jgi:hypothetical protein